MRVGIIQRTIAHEDPLAELQIVARLIEAAAGQGAQLICLPEFPLRTWFPHRPPQAGEALPLLGEELERSFQSLAAEHGCCIHVVDLALQGGTLFNTAMLFAPSMHIWQYQKQHLPNLPGFYESRWYSPGQSASAAFATPVGCLGMLTCSDLMFPEAARMLGLQGADIILAPRATVVVAISRWEVMLRANAIVSGAYVISANRLGEEHGVAFAGHSLIIAPGGDLVLDLEQQEGVALFDLDLELAAQAKQRYPVRMNID